LHCFLGVNKKEFPNCSEGQLGPKGGPTGFWLFGESN